MIEAPPAGPLAEPVIQSSNGMRGFVVSNDFSGATTAPQIDIKSAVAQDQSVGAIGQGIQNVGGALGAIVEIRQRALDVNGVMQAEVKRSQYTGDLQAQQTAEPDVTKWPQITADFLEANAGSLVSPNMSPSAQDHVKGANAQRLARAGAENLSADEALTHAADTATAIASSASRKITAPIDFDHVIGADVKANGKATGGHTLVNGDVRIVPGTEMAPNAQGVYEAGVEMAHPTVPGTWVPKTTNQGVNTMFPKAWSADKVRAEIDAAWHSPAKITTGNIWHSTIPSGVRVMGYISPKTTAYPLY